MSLQWFNASAPRLRVGRTIIRLWNLFNRVVLDKNDQPYQHWWGFGLLQVGTRHLFYVGSGGIRVLFLGGPVVEVVP